MVHQRLVHEPRRGEGRQCGRPRAYPWQLARCAGRPVRTRAPALRLLGRRGGGAARAGGGGSAAAGRLIDSAGSCPPRTG